MSKTPPGPKGEPLFGRRDDARDPFRSSRHWNGPTATSLDSVWGRSTPHAHQPADIERVLVSEDAKFHKPDFQDDAIGTLLGDGLLLSEGETWRKQRELAQPSFRSARLSALADRITGHAEDRIADWSHGDVVRRRAVDDSGHAGRNSRPDDGRRTLRTASPDHRGATLPLTPAVEPDPIRCYATWMPMPDDAEFNRAVRRWTRCWTTLSRPRGLARDG